MPQLDLLLEDAVKVPEPERRLSSPLFFQCRLVPRVWGGRALYSVLNHSLPNDEPYGEAWDVSSLQCHVSRVADGPHSGRSLAELWQHHRKDLAGPAAIHEREFPLLIKWLDCREWLSLQVHPTDQMARTSLGQPRGKSEVWVVIDADSTARVIAGLRPGVTREIFLQHLKSGTIEQCVHSFKPQAGDCIVLPAGTIHAAGGGLLMAEVQQSSDATFRIHDWNRLGLNGRPRELQLDLALEAIDWNQGPVDAIRAPSSHFLDANVCAEALTDSPSFRLDRYRLSKTWVLPHDGEMTIWMVLDGSVLVSHSLSREERQLSRGRTLVIPAAAGTVVMSPEGPGTSATLLCARLPRKSGVPPH